MTHKEFLNVFVYNILLVLSTPKHNDSLFNVDTRLKGRQLQNIIWNETKNRLNKLQSKYLN